MTWVAEVTDTFSASHRFISLYTMPNKQKTDSAAVVTSKLRILKQRIQPTLSTLNRAVTDNDLTLAVQLQQNLDDQLTQLEEQTFAAIDLAESTDE